MFASRLTPMIAAFGKQTAVVLLALVTLFADIDLRVRAADPRPHLGKPGICDLCGTRIGPEAEVYSADEFKAAVENGLRPPESVFKPGMALGVSRETLEAAWIRQVMADRTGWACCSDCSGKVAASLTKVAGGTASPEDSGGEQQRLEEQLFSAVKRGQSLEQQNDLRGAILEFERASELGDQLSVEANVAGKLLTGIASLHLRLGNYREAKPYIERSVSILERSDSDGLLLAEALNLRGLTHRHLGDYPKAEEDYLRVRKIREQKLGSEDPGMMEILNNLAVLYESKCEYTKAEPLLVQSLKIAKIEGDRPQQARGLNSLGLLYFELSRSALGMELLKQSLELKEELYGPNDPNVAITLDNIALIYMRDGDLDQAAACLARSYDIRRATLPPDHPTLAITLHSLGVIFNELEDYERAANLLKKSLEISKARLGPDHPTVARTLMYLAHALMGQGRFQDAKPLLLHCYRITDSKLSSFHPESIGSVNYLTDFYAITGEWDKATECAEKGRRALREHFARVLPYLSESEQLVVAERFQDAGDTAFSIALRRRERPDVPRRSAEWILNEKAVIHQVLTERWRMLQTHGDATTAPLVNELVQVRSELAQSAWQAMRQGYAGPEVQQALVEREAELSAKLGLASANDEDVDSWVGIDGVRDALPEDSLLIEFAKVRLANFGRARLGASNYVVWVIPATGKGDVRLLDLGDASSIEADIQELRRVIGAVPSNDSLRQIRQWNSRYDDAAKALARRLLEPLAGFVEDTERWIISPDAGLWLVPWAALPVDDGRYAIERHQITYVLSGRDLLEEDEQLANQSMVVMGAPDFDLAVEDVRKETALTLSRRAIDAGSPALRHRRAGSLPDKWSTLKGSAKEVEAVVPKLANYGKSAPRVYTGAQALESVFKTLERPRVLVLSTHGFFLEDQDYAGAPFPVVWENRGQFIASSQTAAPTDSRPTMTAIENPLLRCGLVWAGANHRHDLDSESMEDGLLTGLEIVGTDLHGTDLVVLSACDTGVGEVRNGEGVAGLRQSFQLAGARTVVSTLWKIPDEETADLMSAYFQNLASGWSKADALRQAQLSVMQSGREKRGVAHPWFWAGFTLTGAPGVSVNVVEPPVTLLPKAKPKIAASNQTRKPWTTWIQIPLVGAGVCVMAVCVLGGFCSFVIIRRAKRAHRSDGLG